MGYFIWLERKSLVKTFDDEIKVNVQEIRELINEDIEND
jgi:hypothetical protein